MMRSYLMIRALTKFIVLFIFQLFDDQTKITKSIFLLEQKLQIRIFFLFLTNKSTNLSSRFFFGLFGFFVCLFIFFWGGV